jgi:hypothetical protein
LPPKLEVLLADVTKDLLGPHVWRHRHIPAAKGMHGCV